MQRMPIPTGRIGESYLSVSLAKEHLVGISQGMMEEPTRLWARQAEEEIVAFSRRRRGARTGESSSQMIR
jgi:hypothetical protein